MAQNPHLFLLDADTGETFICSTQTFFMGIPETHEGKQYTSMVVNNGMAVRVPGTPEHIHSVLRRQHNYREADWPKEFKQSVIQVAK